MSGGVMPFSVHRAFGMGLTPWVCSLLCISYHLPPHGIFSVHTHPHHRPQTDSDSPHAGAPHMVFSAACQVGSGLQCKQNTDLFLCREYSHFPYGLPAKLKPREYISAPFHRRRPLHTLYPTQISQQRTLIVPGYCLSSYLI